MNRINPQQIEQAREMEFETFVKALVTGRESKELVQYCEQASAGIYERAEELMQRTVGISDDNEEVKFALWAILNHLAIAVIASHQFHFLHLGARMVALQPHVRNLPDKLIWDLLSCLYKLIRNEGNEAGDAVNRLTWIIDNKPETFKQVMPIPVYLDIISGVKLWAKGKTATGFAHILTASKNQSLGPSGTISLFTLAQFLKPGLKFVRHELARHIEGNGKLQDK